MTPRFLLAVPRNRQGPDLAGSLASRVGLEVALQTPAFVLMLAPGTRWLSLGDRGAVIGSLFHRHGPARPIDDLDDRDAGPILATDGGRLIADFWGGYVALVADASSARLLRDPSGAMPCYLFPHPDCMLAASDVELLLATGLVGTSIDWEALAVHLYGAGLPRRQTVLAGVDELLPGFSIDLLQAPERQRLCWSPWDHVRSGTGEDPGETAERLRRVVLQCVRAWASSFDHMLLSVSGGLDSSIVAACLAVARRPEVSCLTMFGEDPGGDERDYARALCRSLNLPLTECRYRVEEVDIEAPLGSHLPRPFGRTQSHAYERAHLEIAHRLGAEAFVTGNGGDNVFAYSQSAAAIADRYLCEGTGAGLLRTLRDVCRQTGCSMFEAAGSAARLLRAPRSYRWRPSPSFLHPEVVAQLAGRALEHPWLEAPEGALPGKAGHIAALLRVQPNLEPGRARHAPVLNPLVSQPIMEACLAIPSWQWRSGGYDRAVARTAFQNGLPELIVRRRSKGGPDAFTAQLIAHYRPRIRERLLDGRLAAHGLIDSPAIERLLADERPTLGEERTRLLTLLSTEAWLDFWVARLAPATRVGEAGMTA